MPGTRPGLPLWLFVGYGGGHIAMLVPVALRVRELGLARPLVLGLTTAHAVARRAGLETVGFADFTTSADAKALAHGEQLAAQLGVAPEALRESAAYLGLGYADLVDSLGEQQAQRAYAQYGRQCLLPVRALTRILRAVSPQLVVATNSPRAEQAAIEAAGQLGIASVCLVDLFAVDEKRWVGRPGYASRVCVLNEQVRQMFLAEGRAADEVVVTGNPAFDTLASPVHAVAAVALRARLAPGGDTLVLFAPSPEPARHPVREQEGNVRLPQEVLAVLLDWARARGDVRIAVRPHPSQRGEFTLSAGDPAVMAGQDVPLEPLLHASDAVCITISTVGLQAHLLGKPVVQVTGSMFDEGAPFWRMGIASVATQASLPGAMDAALLQTAAAAAPMEPALPRVLKVLADVAKL